MNMTLSKRREEELCGRYAASISLPHETARDYVDDGDNSTSVCVSSLITSLQVKGSKCSYRPWSREFIMTLVEQPLRLWVISDHFVAS